MVNWDDIKKSVIGRECLPDISSLLPSGLGDYIDALERLRGLPTDVTVPCALSAMSSAVGNVMRVSSGVISEPLVVWVAVIAGSGYGKTPVIQQMMKPLHDIDRTSFAVYKAQVEQHREILAQPADHTRRVSVPRRPQLKSIVVDQATPEAVIMMHSNNQRSICWHADELMSLFGNINAYNRGDAIPALMQAWSGCPIKVDRKTSGDWDERHIRIDDPAINIIGGVQPRLTRKLFSGESVLSGLPQRFLLIKMSNPLPPLRGGIAPQDKRKLDSMERLYSQVIARANLISKQDSAIEMLPEASELHNKFEDLMYRMIVEDADCDYNGASSKATIYSLRLAAISALYRAIYSHLEPIHNSESASLVPVRDLDVSSIKIDAADMLLGIALAANNFTYFRAMVDNHDYITDPEAVVELPSWLNKLPNTFTSKDVSDAGISRVTLLRAERKKYVVKVSRGVYQKATVRTDPVTGEVVDETTQNYAPIELAVKRDATQSDHVTEPIGISLPSTVLSFRDLFDKTAGFPVPLSEELVISPEVSSAVDSIIAANVDNYKDDTSYKSYKTTVGCIMPQVAAFKPGGGRRDADVDTFTGLIHVDIDTPDDVDVLLQQCRDTRLFAILGKSFSGRGVYGFCYSDDLIETADDYRNHWKAAMERLKEAGISPDMTCGNPSRFRILGRTLETSNQVIPIRISGYARRKQQKTKVIAINDIEWTKPNKQVLLDKMKHAEEGTRNDTLASLTGKFISQGWDTSELNGPALMAGLSQSEITRTINGIIERYGKEASCSR